MPYDTPSAAVKKVSLGVICGVNDGSGRIQHVMATDEGWISCDGRTLRKDHFPKLFAELEKVYGKVPDPFVVPDMRDPHRPKLK